jgi:hypothetical protein
MEWAGRMEDVVMAYFSTILCNSIRIAEKGNKQ